MPKRIILYMPDEGDASIAVEINQAARIVPFDGNMDTLAFLIAATMDEVEEFAANMPTIPDAEPPRWTPPPPKPPKRTEATEEEVAKVLEAFGVWDFAKSKVTAANLKPVVELDEDIVKDALKKLANDNKIVAGKYGQYSPKSDEKQLELF